MRALMALVIFMGVLIVVGLGLLAYGVYREMGAAPVPAAEAPPPPLPAPASAPLLEAPAAPFATALDLGPGATVKSVAEAGGRLAVVVALPGGEERILLLDPSNGMLLGTIAVGQAK